MKVLFFKKNESVIDTFFLSIILLFCETHVRHTLEINST